MDQQQFNDMQLATVIGRFKKQELEACKKDKGIKVSIHTDSYIFKEITYQTCLLKSIENELHEIKMVFTKEQHTNYSE